MGGGDEARMIDCGRANFLSTINQTQAVGLAGGQ